MMNDSKADTIPLDSALSEHLDWFVQLRWLAAALILSATWLAPLVGVALPRWPLTLVVGLILLYNLGFYRLQLRTQAQLPARQALQQRVYAQMTLDWLALSLVVYFTGGIRSPAAIAYAGHLILAAVLLGRTTCYVLAAVAALLLGALAVGEQWAWWPAANVSGPYLDVGDRGYPLHRWLSLSLFFAIVTSLATAIIQRLHRKERDLLRSETELSVAYARMQQLHRLGQRVNTTLDVSEVLELLTERGTNLLGLRASSIRLFSANDETLEYGGSFGLSQAYLEKGPVVVADSPVDCQVLAGQAVVVEDLQSDPRALYPRQARAEGLCSVLCVPMLAAGRTVGVLRLYTSEPHEFTATERTMAQNLANLGAVAVRNAQAYAALQLAHERQAWFARTTHHQLRAPLAAVQTTLHAVAYAGELQAQQRELLGRAQKRVDEMLEMIRDLLDLAGAEQTDAGNGEPVPVLEVIAASLELARHRAGERGIQVVAVLPPADWRVSANAADLERVFSNLLDNAVKYSHDGGEVRLSVCRRAGWVEAIVCDQGIGIAAEDLERIFVGFFRSQAARETGQAGTGLGLSIARRLVHRWRGTLSVESEPGNTRFIVRLPAVAAAEEPT